MDSRINIARSIGLKSIPQFDLNAIFRLDGIIGRQLMSNDKLDSVEIIKSIRDSCYQWMAMMVIIMNHRQKISIY